MKSCQCCATFAKDDAATCVNCGEGTWKAAIPESESGGTPPIGASPEPDPELTEATQRLEEMVGPPGAPQQEASRAADTQRIKGKRR